MKNKITIFLINLCILLFIVFSMVNTETVSNEHNQITSRGLDTKSILNFMSRGFIGASTGASQIVSLNLTNLLVLVLLKALIFAAGTLGVGHLKDSAGYGRNLENTEEVLNEQEILLYLSYLSGDFNCLQNVACQHPHDAKKYAAAGDILLKLSKLFSFNLNDPEKYENYIRKLEEGITFGEDNRVMCNKFICGKHINI